MVDTLLRYVEEQLAQGFKPDIIRARLVRQGYSPALVDGVIESVSIKRTAGAPTPLGANKEKSIFSKLIILLLIMGVIVAGAFVLIPELTHEEKAPLLDVQATPDKFTYNPGDELDFDLEITNMGSSERFDVTLLYRVLDKNDNSVISKEDTTAISTSTSLRKFITLPSAIKAGSYSLKIFANYGGKVATTAFSFEVADKTVITPTQPSCTDGLRNQNELGIDCGGVCGGYWYDSACHPKPKTATNTTTKASCIDGKRNQDEVGIDCGGVCGNYWYDNSCHALPKQTNVNSPNLNPTFTSTMMEVRTTVKTNPEGAKETCLSLGKQSEMDECLKVVGQIALNKDYCAMIVSPEIRDQCYYPIFMKGDYTVCELLSDAESKKSCNQLRDIQSIMNKINESDNDEAAKMTLDSESLNYFNE